MDEREYLNRIGDYFIKKREGALILSPRDIETIKKWLNEEIPLEAIFYGIDKYFEGKKRASRRGGRRSPLRRAEKRVLKAWEEIREAGLGKKYVRGEDEDFPAILSDIASRLLEAVKKNEALSRLLRSVEGIVSEIKRFAEEIEESAISPVTVEEKLIVMEKELFDRVRKEVGEDELRGLSDAIDEELGGYADRMSREALETTKRNLLKRKIREKYDLPEMSLFV
jgi:hypothetical protein